jgi:hypothetical protein
MSTAVPEREFLRIVRAGVAAITADLADVTIATKEIDNILGTLDDEELAKIRTYWTRNPPSVIQGFPRSGTDFPCYAITLSGDDDNELYLAESEVPILDEDDLRDGDGMTRSRRTSSRFAIYVYETHPDLCAYLYRVLRKIILMSTPSLIRAGLDLPKLSGTELVPDPQFAAENMFVRRLIVTVEYDESWNAYGPLWEAINGSIEPYVQAGNVYVHHEDVAYDDEDEEIRRITGHLGTYNEEIDSNE